MEWKDLLFKSLEMKANMLVLAMDLLIVTIIMIVETQVCQILSHFFLTTVVR